MNASVKVSVIGLILLASSAQAAVITIANEADYNTQVVKSGKPTIVKFAAEWCGVCKGVKKPFEELSKEDEFAHVQFVHVNIDAAKSLSDKHNVAGIPTFIYVAKGNKVKEDVGVSDIGSFKENVRGNLRKHFPKAQTSVDADLDSASLEEVPAQQADAEILKQENEKVKAQGILDTIVNFFRWLVLSIITAIQYIIDAIKGLFSR